MISKRADADEELVGGWASRLQRWGVGDLAPVAWEVLRPFGFLGAQALHLLAPVLTAFASPADIERLAARLEFHDAPRDRAPDSASRPNRKRGIG